MTPELRYVAFSAVLLWVMLLTASLSRTRWWAPQGMKFLFSNRTEAAAPSALAGRADRAAKNMIENFLIFAALVLAARAGGVPSARLELGAAVFFWARVVYFGVYLAGIAYLRTAVWSVSVLGLALIAAAMLVA